MLAGIALMAAALAQGGGAHGHDEIAPAKRESATHAVGCPMVLGALHGSLSQPTDPGSTYSRKRRSLRAGDLRPRPRSVSMFGELIGLWSAATPLRRCGAGKFRWWSLGPGRGTMMVETCCGQAKVVPYFPRRESIFIDRD